MIISVQLMTIMLAVSNFSGGMDVITQIELSGNGAQRNLPLPCCAHAPIISAIIAMSVSQNVDPIKGPP